MNVLHAITTDIYMLVDGAVDNIAKCGSGYSATPRRQTSLLRNLLT